MRTTTSSRSATTRSATVAQVQERLAFRLLLVFLVPVAVIMVLGIYAYRLSARVREVEVLERVSYVDRTYANTHNVPWAVEQYQALADRYPTSPRIFVRLGALYFTDSQPARAVDALRQAIALKPDDWEAHSTLAFVELGRNNEEAAIAAGEMALRYNAADVQAYNNLAWVYAKASDPRLRDLARALAYAEKSVSYTRCRQHDYVHTLAEIYRLSGRGAEAEQMLRPGTVRHPLCNPVRIVQPAPPSPPATEQEGARPGHDHGVRSGEVNS